MFLALESILQRYAILAYFCVSKGNRCYKVLRLFFKMTNIKLDLDKFSKLVSLVMQILKKKKKKS